MIYPIENHKITSPYGMRTLEGREPVFHYGVDFTGKNKIAVAPCDIIIVKLLNFDNEYPCKFIEDDKGHFVLNDKVPTGRAWTPYLIADSVSDSTLQFVFKHVNPVVKKGDRVSEGQAIGEVGNYGFSMGSHLHFEVLINGKNVNPQQWLRDNVS